MRRCLPLLVLALVGIAHAGKITTTLHVFVEGFQDGSGQALLLLHDSTWTRLGQPTTRECKARIHAGKAAFEIRDLPVQRWAAIAVHDRNGNGHLDHDWMRLPAEPSGFSNGFRLGALSGFPDSSKLSVLLNASSDTLHLRVR